MRKCTLAVFLFVFVTAYGGAAFAGPCSVLVERDSSTNVIRWSLNRLAEIFKAEDEAWEATGIGDTDYWFTKSPGLFAGINCGSTPYETQEMYPIGVVVKPLSILNLPSFQRGTPILVLTEYGHRKVIALEDIAPISENTTYVFSDSHDTSAMCRTADACTGNDPETCTDCRYGVSPFFGYASAASSDPVVAEAIAAYREISKDAMIQAHEGQWHPDDARAIATRACTPFPVTAWREGGLRHQKGKLHFSLCQDIENLRTRGLKVVNRESAERRFETALWGSFHRNFGVPETFFEESVRALFNKTLISTKPCGVAVKSENTATLGGGLGVELGLADNFELELGANRKVVTTFTQTVPDDVYLLYATYFVNPIQIPGEPPPEKDIWVFDIVFKAKCDDTNDPVSASSIVVFYDKLRDGYETVDASGDLTAFYTSENQNESLAVTRSKAQIESGQFWHISDHIAYFKWRDALRKFMTSGMPEVKQLLDNYPVQQRPIVRDFFVHLILSAAFEYNEPVRYRRPEDG